MIRHLVPAGAGSAATTSSSSATRGTYLLAVVALRGRQTTRVAVALQQEPGWWLLAVAARGCGCWLLVSC
jgi:hypothetical protein